MLMLMVLGGVLLLEQEIKFCGRVQVWGNGYGIRIPKVLVNFGYFEKGKTYKLVVVEIVENRSRFLK